MAINNRKVLVVITARSGSVGIPNKNWKILYGKPLFLWSLEFAINEDYVDRVFISSNCENVEQIFRNWVFNNPLAPVEFIKRPDDISTSCSLNEHALIHALDYYETRYGKVSSNDLVINLQPTSPIRRKNLLKDGVDAVCNQNKKSLLTVKQYTPLFLQKNNDGSIIFHFDRLNRKMRQEFNDCEFYFHDDGCMYITRVDQLRSEKCRLDDDPILFVNDHYSSYQIDTMDDFIIIEKIMNSLDQKDT